MNDIPIAGIGDNLPPEDVNPIIDRLKSKYGPQLDRLNELLEAFERVPKEAEDEKVAGQIATFIKQINVAMKESTELKTAEKAPYLDGTRSVETFFKMISEPLKEVKSLLNERLSKYQKKKAEAEAERRRAEEFKAREAAAAAAKAEAEAAAAVKAAEEAAAKAIEDAKDEADIDNAIGAESAVAKAMEAADKAVEAKIEAEMAADKAEAQAEAGHADMGRVRSESGVTAAAKKSFTGRIVDLPKLDLEALRPYLKYAELERAVKEYAKKTNGQSLTGAEIEEKYTTTVR